MDAVAGPSAVAPAPQSNAGGAAVREDIERRKSKATAHGYAALAERGYTLGDLLGKGGFGQVNRGTKNSTGEM